VRLQHQHVESFGGGIDGGGQTGEPCPDYHQIVHLVLIDIGEPELLGNLQIGGLPQQEPSAHDQGGQVLRPHSKPLQQLLHARVGLNVEVGVRAAVPREELADPQRVRRVTRAHQDPVTLSVRDEECASLQERAQQELAQPGIGLHQREQRLPPKGEHLAILSSAGLHDRGMAEDQIDVSGELAGTLDGDRLLAPRHRLHDLRHGRGDAQPTLFPVEHRADGELAVEPRRGHFRTPLRPGGDVGLRLPDLGERRVDENLVTRDDGCRGIDVHELLPARRRRPDIRCLGGFQSESSHTALGGARAHASRVSSCACAP